MHHIYNDAYNGNMSERYPNWFMHVHRVHAMWNFLALPSGSCPWAMSLNVTRTAFHYGHSPTQKTHLKSHFGYEAILKVFQKPQGFGLKKDGYIKTKFHIKLLKAPKLMLSSRGWTYKLTCV